MQDNKTKYHRATKDTITIPVEELEGMRLDTVYQKSGRIMSNTEASENRGHNNLIDKLIKEYGE